MLLGELHRLNKSSNKFDIDLDQMSPELDKLGELYHGDPTANSDY